jgi:hypothetical protein
MSILPMYKTKSSNMGLPNGPEARKSLALYGLTKGSNTTRGSGTSTKTKPWSWLTALPQTKSPISSAKPTRLDGCSASAQRFLETLRFSFLPSPKLSNFRVSIPVRSPPGAHPFALQAERPSVSLLCSKASLGSPYAISRPSPIMFTPSLSIIQVLQELVDLLFQFQAATIASLMSPVFERSNNSTRS